MATTDNGSGGGTLAQLARAHQAQPQDKAAAIAYSRRLKASGKLDAATAVLEASATSQQDDRVLLVERGLLALERGEAERAQSLLLKSEPKEAKDWRALSALGVASSTLGDQRKAQAYFKQALVAAPDNPVVMNNLALSYVLDKKVEQAESLLRKASNGESAPPQVTQNLMLVAALQGANSRAVVESVTEKPSEKVVAESHRDVSANTSTGAPAAAVSAVPAQANPTQIEPLQPLAPRSTNRSAAAQENKFSVFNDN